MAQRFTDVSFSETIFEQEHLYTCIVCFEDKDLRQLPCGHIECASCIGRRLLEAEQSRNAFVCSLCGRQCPGSSSSSFPPARSAMQANQQVYARRQKQHSDDRGDDSVEQLTRDYERDARELFSKHSRRVEKIQDESERQRAQEHMDVVWQGIEFAFKKLWEWVKVKATEWILGRIGSIASWIGKLFLTE